MATEERIKKLSDIVQEYHSAIAQLKISYEAAKQAVDKAFVDNQKELKRQYLDKMLELAITILDSPVE